MDVCLPWRPTAERVAAHDYCHRFWGGHGFTVIEGDSEAGRPFNRSAARNNAVRLASSDLVVLADADTVPADINQVLLALPAAGRGLVVWPYRSYHLLPADAVSAPDLAKVEPSRVMPQNWRPGALMVFSRTVFEKVGGFDERFVGWGFEDSAFELACRSLAGVKILDGVVYSFDHGDAVRRRDPANQRMESEYRRLVSNPVRMRRLITER